METLVLKELSLIDKQEILNAIPSYIEANYPEFDGDTFATVDFSSDLQTKNFHVTISGTQIFNWVSHEEYEFDCVDNLEVTVHDDKGEIELSNEFISKIDSNLEFTNY